jgi:type 1 fimbria pilin
MRRNVRAALGTALGIALMLLATATAAARTSGKASFRGTIIAPAESGTRNVVNTIIVAQGVFTGVGRIVEVNNRPGDPDNVTRDDLVFPGGTLHVRSTSQRPHFSVDQRSCAFTARVKQSSKIEGGTRRFRHASGTFTGGVRAWGVAPRNPDGTCNQQADALLEVDAVSARGTLSF